MLVPRKESRSSPAYSLPSTKLRNVVCVQCKHRFFLTEFVPLRGSVPLLLECGHVICESCAKCMKPCSRCTLISSNTKTSIFPLNMYALGLLIVSHNHSNNDDETDFSFCQPNKKCIKQPCSKDLCHECEMRAIIKCPQCIALYCYACYSKIHGRALQNHSRIMLSESKPKKLLKLNNICSVECGKLIEYYCVDCNVPGCANCLIDFHPKHNSVSLMEKNHDLMPEFCDAVNRVSACLGRIRHTQKKLDEIGKSPADWESVETSITDHFAQLHGILQNVERKLIDSLYQERENRSENLESIAAQLKSQEDRLQSAFTVSQSVVENFKQVDVKDIIRQLQELEDLPCHLVQDSASGQQHITFHVDKTIIECIEKHCSIEVPPMAEFKIVQTKFLPKDYVIEPLTQEISIPNKINFSSAIATRTRNLPALPSTSLLSIKPPSPTTSALRPSQRIVLSEGTSELINVTRIVDPSCFYVQQMSSFENLKALEKMLASSAAVNSNDLPAEITPDKLYIIQSAMDGKWYRGRITEKNTTPETDEAYRVFLIDYGWEEENVSLERMRDIHPEYAILPAMALQCALYGLVPYYGKWYPAAASAFEDIVKEATLITMEIHIFSGDTYYVDVSVVAPHPTGHTCVAEALVFMKHAIRVTTHKLMRLNPTAVRTYFYDSLDIKKLTNVEFLFAVSPDCIYVCKAPGHSPHFKKLLENMTAEYTRELSLTGFIHVPEIGQPCAALGADGYWYRCIICREPTNNTVSVFFVDMGYEREVRFDEIRVLPKKYMSARTRAIKISVRYVKPLPTDNGKWSAAAIDFTKDTLAKAQYFKVCAFEKCSDTYSVSISFKDTVEFASQLTAKKLAQCTRQSNATGHKRLNKKKKMYTMSQKNTDSTEESEACDATRIKDENLAKENEDPFKICVSVQQVKSPDCIYVAIADRQEAFYKLRKEMKNFYTHNRPEKHDKWVNGAVCAVYSAKDKYYFRAKILNIKSPKEVIVFFYDMGIEETVTIEDIYPLCREYTKSPAYVFKIRLAGILPCGGSKTWALISCRELSEIISVNQSCSFYISKLDEEEDIENTGVPVELWIKQTKMDGPLTPTRIEINSISRMLVEKGFALPIKDYAKKRDQILATELKRQVERRLEIISRSEMRIKWLNINNELGDDDSTEVNTDIDTSNTVSTSEKCDSIESLLSDVPLPPKLSAWLPPAAIQQNHFIAIPTNLDADGFLYLHTKAQHKKSMWIEKKLEKFYKNAVLEPCDKDWAPGDLCIAQYHANHKWYRGKVLQVLEKDTIQVQFVDYGNIEECPIGTIKKKVILGHVPIQCTKCEIWGLKPASEDGNWDTDELDKIHSLLVGKEYEVTVVDRQNGNIVIAITLIPNDVCVERDDLIIFLIKKLGMNISNPYAKIVTSEETMSDTDTPDVVIEYQESISTISDCIEEPISTIGDCIEEPISTIGDCIEEPISTIGNCIEEPISTIGDCIEEPTSTIGDCIEEPITNEMSISVLHETGQEVITEDTNKDISGLEDISCNDVDKRVVLYVPPTAFNEKLSTNYKKIVIPHDVNVIEILVCCSTDTIITAHLKENEHSTILNSYHTRYNLMMEDLQETAFKQPMISSLAPNTPCCAKFGDDLWYRCLITEAQCIQSGGDTKIEVTLVYVDFGNEEQKILDCHKYELYSLKNEWFDVPTMSIKFKLWNIEIGKAGYEVYNVIPDLFSKPKFAKIIKRDEEFINVELYDDKEHTEDMYSLENKEVILRSK